MLAHITIITKLNRISFTTSLHSPFEHQNVSFRMSPKKKYVANKPAKKANI